jgi:hypothetical protein
LVRRSKLPTRAENPAFFNLQEVLRGGMAGHRTVMLYLSIFAGVGLLLAAIGLYGVPAWRRAA